MHILSAIKKIFQPDIQTLNKIEISKANILYNLAQLRTMQPKSAFFPVLKANAYGHGIVQMLEILKGQNFPYVAVDSYPEYQLVHKHSDFDVLLIGETLPENYRFFDVRRTAFVVYNVSTLQALVQLKTKVRIHLFLNTGMNREGVQMENLPEMLTLIQANPRLELEGVMSHFHSADADLNSLQEQIGVFKKMTKLIEDAGFTPKRKHIGASAGLLQMQDEYFTAYRPWLVMYGYAPLAQEKMPIELKPALSVYSKIVALQSLETGAGVSYNQRRKTQSPCKVATIPFGYSEGLLRSLSGKLSYRWQGQDCAQLGTICMNLSSCLGNEQMQIGDEIELISSEKWAENSIQKLSELEGTIPYEVLIRLEKGIRRIVV